MIGFIKRTHNVGFPHSSVGKESTCDAGDPGLIPGLGRSPGEDKRYPHQYSWASLVAQLVKDPPVGDLGSIPGLGRSPGEGKGYPLQYFGLENPMDYIVSPWGCKESDTTERLSLHFIHTQHTYPLLPVGRVRLGVR